MSPVRPSPPPLCLRSISSKKQNSRREENGGEKKMENTQSGGWIRTFADLWMGMKESWIHRFLVARTDPKPPLREQRFGTFLQVARAEAVP